MAGAWWKCPKCSRWVLTRGICCAIVAGKKCPECKTKVIVTFSWIKKIDYYAKVTNVEIPKR